MTPQPNLRRLLVTFVRQEWIGNVAKTFTPPQEVDATEHLMNLTLKEVHSIKDRDASSDEFVDALAWGHYGPFEVRAADAVKAYFGVAQLGDVTQEMLDAAKAGELPSLKLIEPELHCWVMTYGAYALMFSCQAEDIFHAIEQCQNANPGEPILGAFVEPSASMEMEPRLKQLESIQATLTNQTKQVALAMA